GYAIHDLLIFFLSISPAPSDIYTLSLHDALPILISATLNLYLFDSDATTDSTYTVTVHRIVNKNPTITSTTGYTYDGVHGWTPKDRKSTRLNSSHEWISYAVFCLKKKKQ